MAHKAVIYTKARLSKGAPKTIKNSAGEDVPNPGVVGMKVKLSVKTATGVDEVYLPSLEVNRGDTVNEFITELGEEGVLSILNDAYDETSSSVAKGYLTALDDVSNLDAALATARNKVANVTFKDILGRKRSGDTAKVSKSTAEAIQNDPNMSDKDKAEALLKLIMGV